MDYIFSEHFYVKQILNQLGSLDKFVLVLFSHHRKVWSSTLVKLVVLLVSDEPVDLLGDFVAHEQLSEILLLDDQVEYQKE